MSATETAAGEQPEAGPDKAQPTAPGAARTISRGRLALVDGLIALTTILALVGMMSVWANRLLFNPDNWENTSTQLLQNSDIRSATSNYVVTQLYQNVNVPGLIKSALPPRLQPLADPAAGALRNVAVQGVELALSRPRVQALWAKANRAADKTFIAIVHGGKGAVKVNHGEVTLDLASVIGNLATQLGLPPSIVAKLPASIGELTVFKSSQLSFVQKVGNAVQSLALWLTILVPVLYALSILLAGGHRRRTLMTVGFAIVFAGVIGFAGRAVLQSAITNSITSDAALRPAVRATVGIGTSILGEIAGAFVFVGAVVIVSAWFAGPARVATVARWAIAPFLRDEAVGTFAIVLGLMVLVFLWDPIPATGTPVGIIVFLALALFGTEMLRRQTAIEFPSAQRGDAARAFRARFRGRREDGGTPPPASAATVDQLERLSKLRDQGSITPAEYEAAKARLLPT